MKTYEVVVTETSSKVVEIEAESQAEAEELAEKQWNQSEIILAAEDFDEAAFSARDLEKSKDMIRILFIRPGEEPVQMELENTLDAKQKAVGGFIECFMPFEEEVAIICNEEGKLEGLPLNRSLKNRNGEIYEIIAGDFFLCGAPGDSDSFTSLSNEQMEHFKERFRYPEKFYQTDRGIKAVLQKPGAKEQTER